MVDMSVAFYVVDIEILRKKCQILNIESETLKWLESYLSQRQQSVNISGHFSIVATLEARVQKESILGPLLYTITDI